MGKNGDLYDVIGGFENGRAKNSEGEGEGSPLDGVHKSITAD